MSASAVLAERIEYLETVMEEFDAIADEHGWLSGREVTDHLRNLRLCDNFITELWTCEPGRHFDHNQLKALENLSRDFSDEYLKCVRNDEKYGSEFNFEVTTAHSNQLISFHERLTNLYDNL